MTMRWVVVAPRERAVESMTWPDLPGVFVADTPSRCREALRIIKAQKIVGVDVEAYGCNPKKEHPKGKAKAISVQFAGARGPKIFVPLWAVTEVNDDGSFEIDPQGREHLLDIFAEWLEDATPTKVLHNGKFDRHVLANHDIMMRGFLGDTLVMDYFYANGERLHGLKECVRRYFHDKSARDYSEVFKRPKPLKKPRKNKKTGELEYFGKQKYLPSLLEVVTTQEGVDQLVDYAVKDPWFTVKLYTFLRDKLKGMPWAAANDHHEALSYFEFYTRVARPYGDVLFDMESEGCRINEKKLSEVSERIDHDIEEVERDFVHACVERGIKPSRMAEFNLNSSAQVSSLLYDELDMRCEKPTEEGGKSTSKSALEAIVSKKGRSRRATEDAELVEILLKHRAKTTLRKMFIRPLVKFTPEYGGRVHSNFKQTGTKTGRLSSATPNLENIPANKKDEEYELRSLFIAPEGYVVADIDLKQIEVRLMAHFTKDPVLLELLKNGWDQHLIAMCMLFAQVREFMGATYVNGVVTFSKKKPPDGKASAEGEEKFGKSQWGEWRRRAKVLNFGVSYGMGAQGFANQIGGGATVEDGRIAITAYFKGFRGLEKGIRRIKNKCHRYGFVKTMLKRYCMIPAIHSSDKALMGQAERQSFNYVIQGSAADMIMLGMLLCWLDPRLRRWGVKMINQIHDEVVFLVKKKWLKKAKPIIEEYISHPYRHTLRVLGFAMNDLILDTPADLGTGANWMEAKK